MKKIQENKISVEVQSKEKKTEEFEESFLKTKEAHDEL